MSIRELIVLTHARNVVRARPPERHAEVRRGWLAARARLRVAERLDPQTELAAALPLYRDGVTALVGAALVTVEGAVRQEDVASVEAAWSALERVWPQLCTGAALVDFTRAGALLRTRTPPGEIPSGEAASIRLLDRLVSRVERAIEPRTARALAARRAATIAGLAAVPLIALAVLAPPLLGPKSLALHKPVKMSSSHPDSLAPPTGEDVVNGKIELAYGAHTNVEDAPWILIDLEQPRRVRRIVVYNRGDGWFAECLPLDLEVGTDAQALHVVATRETLFTQHEPWEVRLDEDVRFVRLSHKGHGYVALAEVGVYSR